MLPPPPPPASPAPSRFCREIRFDGETFATTSSPSGPSGAFVDEEFVFNIDSYFGGANLQFEAFERGLFGTRSPLGSVQMTVGEVLQRQLERYRRLGMETASNAAGELAVDYACSRIAPAFSGPCAPRMSPPYAPRADPAITPWFEDGVNPLLLDSVLRLAGCTLRVQLEFMLDSALAEPIGPRGCIAVHRYGAYSACMRACEKYIYAPPCAALCACEHELQRSVVIVCTRAGAR